MHGAEFEAAAKNQQINRYDLVNAANRGSILDRNEQVLAVSTAVYNVVLDPLQLAEEDDAKKTKKTFDTLCEYFPDLNYEDLEYHITKKSGNGQNQYADTLEISGEGRGEKREGGAGKEKAAGGLF